MRIYLLIAMCMLFSACSSPELTPSKTAEAFVKSMCDGDVNTSINSVSAPNEIAPKTMQKALSLGFQRCKQKGGFKSFQIDDEKIEGETAFVNGKVIYNNNSDEPLTMKLLKEKGQWKIVLRTPEERQKNQ